MTKREALQSLHSVLHLLPANKRDFANSLLDQAVARGDLSQNQWHWVLKLTEMADHAPTAPAQAAAPAANFKQIVDMLTKAATGRERLPSFLILAEGNVELKVKLAGATSRHPGSVNVTWSGQREPGTDRDIWFGRILTDGTWDRGAKCTANVTAALRAFCADPAAAAKAFGDATKVCCFCAKALTDRRSVAVGWGPVCAEKFSLPWGEVEAPALACEAVA